MAYPVAEAHSVERAWIVSHRAPHSHVLDMGQGLEMNFEYCIPSSSIRLFVNTTGLHRKTLGP
jgi:hypothetical protein